MNVSIKTLNKRLPEVIKALDKNERVVLSHEGKEIALLQPVSDVEGEIQRIKNHPAVGMWADREDMKDPSAWLHDKRMRRRERLLGADGGDGK